MFNKDWIIEKLKGQTFYTANFYLHVMLNLLFEEIGPTHYISVLITYTQNFQ